MDSNIIVKEISIEEAVKVSATITEFDKQYSKEYFTDRYGDKEHLITVAYVDAQPAGYMVSYDKFSDKSFYCWMAGVNPEYRKMGILKALMEYLENWAGEKGYSKIKITTRNNKREMLGYLVKYGFYFTEVVPKEHVEENRVHLEKSILPIS